PMRRRMSKIGGGGRGVSYAVTRAQRATFCGRADWAFFALAAWACLFEAASLLLSGVARLARSGRPLIRPAARSTFSRRGRRGWPRGGRRAWIDAVGAGVEAWPGAGRMAPGRA